MGTGFEPGMSLILSYFLPKQARPLSHSTGLVLPKGAHSLTSTGVQPLVLFRPVWFEYVPPGHGLGLVEPIGQKFPGLHGLHAVLPLSG